MLPDPFSDFDDEDPKAIDRVLHFFRPADNVQHRPATYCKLCRRETAHAKPYCIDHLELLPFPKAIRAEIQARETEIHAAAEPRGWRKLNLGGTRSHEILALVYGGGGEVSMRRLRIELLRDETELKENRLGAPVGMGKAADKLGDGFSDRAFGAYLKALEKAGMITMDVRGTDHGMVMFVRLTEIGKERVEE